MLRGSAKEGRNLLLLLFFLCEFRNLYCSNSHIYVYISSAASRYFKTLLGKFLGYEFKALEVTGIRSEELSTSTVVGNR